MKLSNFYIKALVSASLLVLTTGCLQQDDGATASVNFASNAFVAPQSVGTLAISDFQFCVTKVKFVAEGADAASTASVEARIGLVNPGDGSIAVDWGSIAIPEGAIVKTVMVEIHKDAQICNGADFSVSYNGQALNQDVEMKFNLNQEISLIHGDTLNFDLTNIVQAFNLAYSNGHFSDGAITSYLETIQDSVSVE